MTRLETSQRFEVPVAYGFAFITNTTNWPTFWPGYVRLEEGSRWQAVGDGARRAGFAGVVDRLVLPHGIRRACQRTFAALTDEFSQAQPSPLQQGEGKEDDDDEGPGRNHHIG